MTSGRIPRIALACLALVTALAVASDGRHHWDEPTYLYAGAYVDVADILEGQVQPSGIGHFTQGRILHALLVKAMMAVAPTPTAGYRAMIALNLALLAGSAILLLRILRRLLPAVSWVREATALMAMSPVFLYLAFCVLADVEALFAALLATYALLRLAQGGGFQFAAMAAVAIALSTLSKNQMAWMPATFWATFCLVPVAHIDRRRLALYGAASGVAAVAITIATLEWLGIGIEAYWSSYRGLASGNIPLMTKALAVLTELGILWLLLPAALLTRRRRELAAFALWLALAMAPFILIINSIEARHLAVNLAAAGGLMALALEFLAARAVPGGAVSGLRFAGATAAIVVIMATNALVLAIMPHRIDTDQMRSAIDALDARFGAGRYVLLTGTGYTDFHMIRVLWPDIDVRDPSTADTFVHRATRTREEALEQWYQGRHVESVAALRESGKPIAYLGYGKTFAAENLREMLESISPTMARRLFGDMRLPDRLFAGSTRWLWSSPGVEFDPIAATGHYHTFEVTLPRP